ncbi:JAB domain-containing protein [Clostridiaceae bacterium]|nr:JAB domain-containing protein [Clostridiaceae bacterium]RKI13101.1 JAB domain-containing protein [bacterium 1XD21-70]
MRTMKIKDIPNDDRPYERCLREGPERLSDVELLSILIRNGYKDSNSLDLASDILALNYPKDGILGLLHLTLPELTSVKGIGVVKGIQLLCIGELSRRIWKRKARQKALVFMDPGTVAEYFQEDMRHMGQEQFYVMLFNTRQMLIRDILISKGTVNASLATPREIFIEALRYQAVSLILVHNHPSGDPEPSKDDIMLTRRVLEAGRVIGIALQDHVVVGEYSYVSMKERGLL